MTFNVLSDQCFDALTSQSNVMLDIQYNGNWFQNFNLMYLSRSCSHIQSKTYLVSAMLNCLDKVMFIHFIKVILPLVKVMFTCLDKTMLTLVGQYLTVESEDPGSNAIMFH